MLKSISKVFIDGVKISTSFFGFLFSMVILELILPNWSELSHVTKNTSLSIPNWLLNLGVCLSIVWLILTVVFDSNDDEFLFRELFHDENGKRYTKYATVMTTLMTIFSVVFFVFTVLAMIAIFALKGALSVPSFLICLLFVVMSLVSIFGLRNSWKKIINRKKAILE